MTNIQITDNNIDFWAMALKARKKQIVENLDKWWVGTSSMEWLREQADELCKVCAYLDELLKN